MPDAEVSSRPPAAPAAALPALERLNPTGRDYTLSAPLRDGAFVLAEVLFTLTKDDKVLINSQRLLAALRPVLSSSKYDELAIALGSGDVPIDQLAGLGYKLHYDPTSIALDIEIPADARNSRQLRLTQLGEDVIGEVDQPAPLSAFLNLRSSVDYQWQGIGKGFQDPLVETDWGARVAGVVFEGEGTAQIGTNGNKTRFRREGTRFVYDDPGLLARFTAGDLQPTSRGFSGSSQMAGLSMTRSYSVLQPQRNVQPRGDRTFTLTRSSTVEAYINGQAVRQVRLEPGTYNVRDFPFVQGANDVRLLITDDTGRQETVEFSLFFDRTLLEPGLTEFGIYAGVLAPFSTNGRHYTDRPAANGFIRRGLTQSVTAGANFQAQARGGVLGAEIVWASPLGTIGFDLAASHVKQIGTGYALNVGLQRTIGGTASRGKAISLTFETRSKNFANPGDIAPDNRYAFEVGATYSQSIGELQFVSFDGRYSKGRGPFPNEKSARISYGYRLSQRLNLQAEGVYQSRNTFGKNYGVRVNLTYRFGQRSSANAEYDSRSDRARIGYQTSSGSGVGAYSISANADYGQGDMGLDGAVSYTANRAELSVAHTTSFGGNGGFNITDQRSSLRLGTALVLAEGHVALSRPVYDSFALVVPHKTLKGTPIYLEPREGRYTAKSGTLGGAVANDLSSYSDRVVTFNAPDAPVGYDLGAGNVRVYPPYKAGYLVEVGSDYSITALGRLLNDDGEAIALLAGQAFEVAKPDQPPATIFTNRAGRFGISGLRPGEWRIEMPTEPKSTFIITIPQNSTNIVHLGDVQMRKTP